MYGAPDQRLMNAIAVDGLGLWLRSRGRMPWPASNEAIKLVCSLRAATILPASVAVQKFASFSLQAPQASF
jgi:hypothetical protein